MSQRTFLLLAAAALACAAAGLLAQPASKPSPEPAGEGAAPEPPRHRPWMITEAQEKELLDVLQQKMPARHERLMTLKESNPVIYRQVFREAWRWYLRWKDAPKDVQDAYVAEQLASIKIGQLISRYAESADPAEKERVKAELEQAAAAQFDANQQILKYRLSTLEEQIDRLQKDLASRQQQREKLIAESVDKWLKAPPPGPPGPRGPGSRPSSMPARPAATPKAEPGA